MAREETGGARTRLRQLERVSDTTKLSTFLETIDEESKLSRKNRLRILDQALLMLEMNYVHLPLKRAMHAIDPIRRLKLIKFRLEDKQRELESETQFHRRLLEIFASLRDLHTHYQLPAVFEDQMAFLPFLIEQYFVRKRSARQTASVTGKGKKKDTKEKCMDRMKEKFMVSRIARNFCRWSDHTSPEVANFEAGVEVVAWNGMPIRRAIELNGETQAGSNLEARFARGLDSLTIRPLETSLPPDESWVSITYRPRKGRKLLTLDQQEWRVGELGAPPLATRTTRKKRAAIDIRKTKINQLKKQLYVQKKQESPAVRWLPVRQEFRTELREIFYAQARRVSGREIGYIRLFSFDVDDPERFVEAFRQLITSKAFPQEGLIIDVRGNGGGKIRAGERLLQLFTPRHIEPELFEFINSPVNLEICKQAPTDWELNKWEKSIREAVETGATYSMGFPLNDEESCNDIGQVYHGPVILITDALSYSTTDMFAAGFQDNEVGPVLGTSDNTGAGGANNWTYKDLQDAVRKAPNSPFKRLPKGADLVVAMRRSIRVGSRMGKLLEELGIDPDETYCMTKNDLLKGNVDLIRHAVGLLNEQPIYSLSVKPIRRKAGVKVIAGSKVPPDKPLKKISYLNKKISYLNIFLNDRIHPPTIEAKDGAIEAEVILPRRRGKTEVRVEAFDGANNLVAAYRRTI